VKPPADVWSDLQAILDDELNRLPDKLRLPVVLCDLEGRPQRHVAAQLKLPPATLATRLASARRTLAARLTKRGVTLSGGALATLIGDRASAAIVPSVLADTVVRTAEAVALGVPATALASAQAVHLSEGVMRMMLVAKLKAVSVLALSVLALTGGLGLGLMPAHAGDEPAVRVIAVAQPDAKAQPAQKPADDAEFLNRLSLDLRGTRPTLLELFLFAADPDPNKRTKVINWFLADEAVKKFLAEKFKVKVEAILTVKALDLGDGKPTVLVTLSPEARTAVVKSLAFSPDGKTIAIEEAVPFRLNLNATPDQEVRSFLFAVQDPERAALVDWITAAQPPQAGDTGPWVIKVRETNQYLPGQRIRYWDTATGQQVDDGKKKVEAIYWVDDLLFTQATEALWVDLAVIDSDAEFLRRAVTSARGTPPTPIEEKYFAEDKDPKKREKLLDTLLKDPAVQKKVGDEWKKQMLAPPASTMKYKDAVNSYYRAVQSRPVYEQYYTVRLRVDDPAEERLGKLIDSLIAAKKPDDQVFDGLALTIIGRLPTESEKSLTLTGVAKAQDKRAAWLELGKALAATEEGKKHAESLKGSAAVAPAKP
jgi:hypothetical protein